MTRYTVLIIGAGQIASGYDSVEQGVVLTHCKALSNSEKFIVRGIYDFDNAKAIAAGQKWGIPALQSLAAFERHSPDVVLISTSTPSHEEYLMRVLNWKPKLVVCEKPLTDHLAASRSLLKLYAKKSVPLVVTYQRRYDSDLNNLREQIVSGKFGRLINGYLLYSKGILNCGSHGIDLLIDWFGEVREVKFISATSDYRKNDPTVSGVLFFRNASISLLGANSKYHSMFELDLIFEEGRIQLIDGGHYLKIHRVAQDEVYPKERILTTALERQSSLRFAMREMWAHFGRFLDSGGSLPTAAQNALQSQVVCDEFIKLACGSVK